MNTDAAAALLAEYKERIQSADVWDRAMLGAILADGLESLLAGTDTA